MKKSELIKYFNPDFENNLDYSYFDDLNHLDDKIIGKIISFIKNNIKSILLININEDKFFFNENELGKLPQYIRNLLKYSELRGIKIYVFKYKEEPEKWKQAEGFFGGTKGRNNEYYFGEVINRPEISKIVTKINIDLSSLLKSD